MVDFFGSESPADEARAREELLARIAQLHEDNEQEQIIDLIEQIEESERGYQLTCLLARAYVNFAQPDMDNFRDLLNRAHELLMSVETDGMSDDNWHHRMGAALYWLDREPEALVHFEQAVALNPEDTDSADGIVECKRIIERNTLVKPMTSERLAEYFEFRDWKYELTENGVLKSAFGGQFLVCFEILDRDLKCWSVWGPDVPLESRSDLLETCQEWNRNTRRPKAYASTNDDGSVWVCGEHFVFIGAGLTDQHLAANIEIFLHATNELCEFLAERFPELAPAEKEADDEE